jgi:FixJ family two-component response regulator
MPLMGGIELASLLTKDRPDMKLLFMSGHTESAIMLDASVSFIRKPCRTVDLIKRIRQELEPAT